MNNSDKISESIQDFKHGAFKANALAFFQELGYHSNRTTEADLKTSLPLKNPEKALVNQWQAAYLLFQLADDEIKRIKPLCQKITQPIDNTLICSFLFIALELNAAYYSRTELATITRVVNKLFDMPAIMLFKHEDSLTLSVIHRRLHQRDENKNVLEKVTLIKDISITEPHRAQVEILQQLSLQSLNINNFVELYQAWQKVLDISIVNKQFYQELSVLFTQLVGGERHKNSYQTLLKLPSITDDKVLKEFAVRLIGRLLFCWFLQKKTSKTGVSLIPNKILSSESVQNNFYHAVLEPLFFEVLNKELKDRKKDFQQQDWAKIPFLNGGLFESHLYDFYDGSCTLNTLIVPDEWLARLLHFLSVIILRLKKIRHWMYR